MAEAHSSTRHEGPKHNRAPPGAGDDTDREIMPALTRAGPAGARRTVAATCSPRPRQSSAWSATPRRRKRADQYIALALGYVNETGRHDGRRLVDQCQPDQAARGRLTNCVEDGGSHRADRGHRHERVRAAALEQLRRRGRGKGASVAAASTAAQASCRTRTVRR